MTDQTIACPSCGKKIPLTRALRAEIEAGVKDEYERQLEERVERAAKDAAKDAEQKAAQELAAMLEELTAQSKELEQARRAELEMRRRERELERQREDLELTLARKLDDERARIVSETQARVAEQQRLKDAERERQLADMRRQIEELKRRAEQGSQQAQGEAGEAELEMALRAAFPLDEILPVAQGIRGADIHQVVLDMRGIRCGAILWECKNTKHWSDGWIAKLKEDQRTLGADMAVLVASSSRLRRRARTRGAQARAAPPAGLARDRGARFAGSVRGSIRGGADPRVDCVAVEQRHRTHRVARADRNARAATYAGLRLRGGGATVPPMAVP